MATKRELRDAIRGAIDAKHKWSGGAMVIKTIKGFDFVPGAYQNDASWSPHPILIGPHEIENMKRPDPDTVNYWGQFYDLTGR